MGVDVDVCLQINSSTKLGHSSVRHDMATGSVNTAFYPSVEARSLAIQRLWWSTPYVPGAAVIDTYFRGTRSAIGEDRRYWDICAPIEDLRFFWTPCHLVFLFSFGTIAVMQVSR